jgi:ADP-ribose pyrophosphatase
VRRTLPTGGKVDIDLIEHPGAVLIVPFLSKNEIVFLRQYRAAIKKYLIELPAGTLHPKEQPLACAQRELIEEANFKARRMKKLGRIYPVPGYSTEVIHIYKAEGLCHQQGIKDMDELISIRVFTKPQVKNLFQQGKVTDAKTIAGLAMAGWI